MKKFKDLPLDKNLEIYAKKNIPNNPDPTSTPEELKKKMLYGSAETFITRLKMKLLYSGIDESTTAFINKFRQLYRTGKLMTFKQWINVMDDLIVVL